MTSEADPISRGSRRRLALVGLGLVAVTLAGLLIAANREGFWYDETYQAAVATLPWPTVLGELRANDASLSVAYLATKAWSELAGIKIDYVSVGPERDQMFAV